MTQPAQPMNNMRAAVARRLSAGGQKQFGDADPKVAAFQYSNGQRVTGEIGANDLAAGWGSGGESNPYLVNPNVQAYGQYALADQTNNYDRNTQGASAEQIRQLLAYQQQQGRQR